MKGVITDATQLNGICHERSGMWGLRVQHLTLRASVALVLALALALAGWDAHDAYAVLTGSAKHQEDRPASGPMDDDYGQGAPAAVPRTPALVQTQSVFTVNSVADAVDAVPGNGVCETAPGNGVCTLRAAILEANQLSGLQTINLPNGTYALTLPGFEDNGSSDDLDIRGTITIVGQDAASTIVDGSNQFRVFDVRPGATATLSNLTIRNGSLVNNQGAGLRNQGTTTMQNVRVVNNSATSGTTVQGNGAGIENAQGGVLTLTDSLVSGNHAIASTSQGAFGGGIANFGIAGSSSLVTSQLTIVNSTILNNVADNSSGGLTINQQGAKVTVQGSTFSGNHAVGNSLTGIASGGTGGAIGIGGSGASQLSLDTTVVTGNSTSLFQGGGINALLSSSSTSTVQVTIDRSTIDANTATTSSGGIAFGGPGSTLTVTSSTISNNHANGGNGGGMAAGFSGSGSPGVVTMSNVTFSGNVASGGGGAIASSVTTSILNGTIVGNGASAGGAFNTATNTLSLKNTIVGSNTAPTAANCQGAVISLGGNIDFGSSCALAGSGDRSNTEPRLGVLANNGGPTMTHLPQPGSLAIDLGSNSGCPATDQRGLGRPFDGNSDGTTTCDIGAVEAQTPFSVVCSPRPPIGVSVARTGDGRLQVALSTQGANNAIRAIQVVGNSNGILSFTEPRLGLPSSTFIVSRQTPSGGATVRLLISDACGDWPTFVGGGPNAF